MLNSFKRLFLCAIFVLLSLGANARADVKPGADVLIEKHLALLLGKRVGLITNQTGRLSTGESLLDALLAKHIMVTALFAPEHGTLGEADPGATLADSIDSKHGIPIFSLYGKTRKPTRAMLSRVDLLLYDLQDVGVRFYTYISTMTLAMEACAEAHIPIVVLDRPDPLGGLSAEGPVLPDSLRSFVGMLPLPIVYGLTCGELAKMINGERWLAQGMQSDLIVIPMEGWSRSLRWEDTGMPWVPPSPNLPSPSSALVYPGMCLLESTNVSEGRGTPAPFQTIGAPFLDSRRLADSLNGLRLPGVRFNPTTFIPRSSKHQGKQCYGVSIEVTSPGTFNALLTGLSLIDQLIRQGGDSLIIHERQLALLLGDGGALRALRGGESPELVARSWESRIGQFGVISSKYRIYSR